jgi:Protein of unknown function (DUF3052)
MGYEAACTLRVGRETSRGKAVLEQHDLIFRGPTRLSIPLKEIASAVASEGALTVRFGRTTAIFEIGPIAARWAQRITNPPSRLDKLGVKAGTIVGMAGTRHDELLLEVESRGARVPRSVAPGTADIVFYGAERREVLDRISTLKRSLKPDGALWIIRPKGSTAISESEVMSAGKRAGLVDVKVVSFSETHTAEKFVIPRANRQR